MCFVAIGVTMKDLSGRRQKSTSLMGRLTPMNLWASLSCISIMDQNYKGNEYV